MIDLPTNAEVHCSDGIAGFSTFVIGNPINHRMTHVVVQSDVLPFYEYLVPVDQVAETTPNMIKLNCTLEDLRQKELFKVEKFIPTEMPGNLSWPYCVPIPGAVEEEAAYIPVEHQNIPWGEQALRRGARVEASDGYIGQVEELLINSTNMQVTHLVLLERHIFKQREITIPVSQIDRVNENTIYLKLNRQSVEALPTTPIQRWLP
ncbi:MAG TPA: hypothetical protein VMC62_08055 [Longilinea sp.]|nr:hypothetical protein [Longilinea sp.]